MKGLYNESYAGWLNVDRLNNCRVMQCLCKGYHAPAWECLIMTKKSVIMVDLT